MRHRLTETLKTEGGHTGFGVRPSAQGRGVGKELLRQTLIEAGKLGIHQAVLTCDKSNVASSAVIIANGGKPEAEYHLPSSHGMTQQYTISISSD